MTAVATTRTGQSNGALLGLWALFWLAMAVVALQEASRNEHIRPWEPLLWEGSSALIATLWLLAARSAEGRYAPYLDRPWLWFAHYLKWLPLVAATFIPSIYLLRHAVYSLLGERYSHDAWGFVAAYETTKIVLFSSLWLGIMFGINSFAQWRSERERLLAAQKALAETQLQQLAAQLRPHFLFNALNTISALMHVDIARADRLLARVGDLLRISVQAQRTELTSLREELRLLELYAKIMEERFAERVTLEWSVEEQTLDGAVPALLLQPFLENAFKHGVEPAQAATTIAIQTHRRADALELVIANSGGTLAIPLTEGVGLRNCRERLQLLYAQNASLELAQTPSGVTAKISVPWREHRS